MGNDESKELGVSPYEESGELPVGEVTVQALVIEYSLEHRSPAVWVAKAIDLEAYGAAAEQALSVLLSMYAARIQEEWLKRVAERSDENQAQNEATRNMYGNEVSSEELRDMYLGENGNQTESESNNG